MNWWHRFLDWVFRMVTGRSWFVGVDHAQTDKDMSCMVVGFKDRKGVMHIVDRHFGPNREMEAKELQQAFANMGYSAQQVNQNMHNWAKSFPSAIDMLEKAKLKQMAKETTELANKEMLERKGMWKDR